MVDEAFAAAGGRCALAARGRCSGGLTPHRLRKGSAGWDRRSAGYVEGNVVALCAGCNVWVEDYPVEAAALGLVVRG